MVYHPGGFAFGPRERWPGILGALQGRKILCLGNHDRKATYMIEQVGFEDAFRNRVVEVDGVRLWLHHYPTNNALDQRGFQRPPAPEEYDVALCGHIHQLWKLRDGCVNVGVDVWDFTPIVLDEILTAANAK